MSPQTSKNLALADQHFRAGRAAAAESLLQEIVASDPRVPKAFELLAYLAGNQGRLDACEAFLARAFDLPGCSVEAIFYLGKVRLQRGRPAEALGPLRRCVERNATFFEALHEMGVCYSALGDEEQALALFRRAERLQPRSHELQTNLASSLAALRRYDDALRHSQAAISLEPRWVKAWTDLGQTFTELRQLGDALKCFDRALALAPQDIAAWRGKAVAMTQSGRHAEALAAYRSLAALAPETDYLRGSLLLSAMRVCDWSDWDAQVQLALEGVAAGRRVAAPFSLLMATDRAQALLDSARILARDVCPALPAPPPRPAPAADQRQRIAYFSADFGDHPTSQLIAGLFEQHDRSRFEVFAYSIGVRPEGAMRQRIAAGVDHFIDVAGLSDAQVAARSRSDGIDIAIDLMGFTEGCRPKIFACRPAPIQVGFLGFPGTMGSDCLDYLVADATVIGVEDRVFYAEKVVTLPGSYQVNDNCKAIASEVPSRAEVGLPADGFVFASFNGLQKLTPAMFGQWMQLLHEAPGSVLWLLRGPEPATAALQVEASRRGIDPARIVWAEPLPLAEHLARHALADLFLDTFPCNAHTTCSDALWAGLPVLTLSGQGFASRVAGSLLRTLGLPELVTTSFDDYRALALALAASPQALAELRQRLQRGRMASPLFDTPLFARRIEAAYRAMAERQRQGLPPDHLDIPAELPA